MNLSLLPIMSMLTIYCFTSQRNHMLMALLSLEAIILTFIMSSISLISSLNNNEPFLILILLTFAACEASLGLACLVLMTRSFGNDMINSLSINKC
uniref:NADH-ubiquinone oxidoreductase chain 4L n=1 Tax=Laetmonice producta TaxID=2153329 RepID=A0A343W6F0_9ANNE|nr:NADH dehydrogenase subunit 4L [Laetmonice producta]